MHCDTICIIIIQYINILSILYRVYYTYITHLLYKFCYCIIIYIIHYISCIWFIIYIYCAIFTTKKHSLCPKISERGCTRSLCRIKSLDGMVMFYLKKEWNILTKETEKDKRKKKREVKEREGQWGINGSWKGPNYSMIHLLLAPCEMTRSIRLF